MEKLIALQDINETIKAGDHFDAPDQILVALGLAELDGSASLLDHDDLDESAPEAAEHVPQMSRRRRRGRLSS